MFINYRAIITIGEKMAKGSTKKIIDVSKKVHSKNDASLFKTTIDILNCKKKYNKDFLRGIFDGKFL